MNRIITLVGSHGELTCDSEGNILSRVACPEGADCDCNGEGYNDHARIHVAEWDQWHKATHGCTSDLADVTEVGITLTDGQFLEPSEIFRALQEDAAKASRK